MSTVRIDFINSGSETVQVFHKKSQTTDESKFLASNGQITSITSEMNTTYDFRFVLGDDVKYDTITFSSDKTVDVWKYFA
ncbi:hypothetical protein PNOK_0960900 [Pyrrhoderma noxium]|uniref:Uncharacterized protein n=1 Tax=Pyrrhoderma noxium TaxID=2282107 RepID=A0A286U647_9AGAM|nr:hypothetical protein PNOK_0960900 [Pyrrhoderma noxium]